MAKNVCCNWELQSSVSDSAGNILLSQSKLNKMPKSAKHAMLQSKWSW